MSDAIAQIQASYNPIEDRILLKIKTLNEQVYLAWITRSFMKLLIPALHGQHPTTGQPLFSEDTSPETATGHAQTGISGNYGNDFVEPENPEYPLGEQPILLIKITFKNIRGDNGQLIFEPEQGRGIVLPYHPNLLGPLINIFSQALNSADWALELDPILEVPEETRLQ